VPEEIHGLLVRDVELDARAIDWTFVARIDVTFAFDAEAIETNVQLTCESPNARVATLESQPHDPAYSYQAIFTFATGGSRGTSRMRGNKPRVTIANPFHPRSVDVRSIGIVDGAENITDIFLQVSDAATSYSLHLDRDSPATQVTFATEGTTPLSYSGTVVFEDGGVRQIVPTETVGSEIVAGNVPLRFSVRIDPLLVQWSTGIENVRVGLAAASSRSTFDFDPATPPQVWEFGCPPDSEATYVWSARYRYGNGTWREVRPRPSHDRNLVLPPTIT
jgi:hypothetical protein